MSVKQTHSNKKIWIVAAGTGGHIFPGLSVANALKESDPSLEFLFFGTQDRLESKLVPSAGYRICFLKASQWMGRSFLAKPLALWDLFCGFFQVLGVARREGSPLLLLSVGGYVSVPVSLVAILLRVPFYIIEPNICSGISNRFLSRFSKQAFSVPFSDAFKKFGCPVLDSGNPTRRGLFPVNIRKKVERLLVLGGSQGAAKLTETMLRISKDLPPDMNVHIQCGDKNLTKAQKLFQDLSLGSNVTISAFIEDVPGEIMKSDLVVSRAGAMSVAELCNAAVPTLFVPYPFAADDHQKKNAALLEEHGAAKLICEGEDFDQRLSRGIDLLSAAPDHEKRRLDLHQKMRVWARPDATEVIAHKILETL